MSSEKWDPKLRHFYFCSNGGKSMNTFSCLHQYTTRIRELPWNVKVRSFPEYNWLKPFSTWDGLNGVRLTRSYQSQSFSYYLKDELISKLICGAAFQAWLLTHSLLNSQAIWTSISGSKIKISWRSLWDTIFTNREEEEEEKEEEKGREWRIGEKVENNYSISQWIKIRLNPRMVNRGG